MTEVCVTPEDAARRDALLALRREVRRWTRQAGNRRAVEVDDLMAAHRVTRAVERFRAMAA